MSADLIRSRFVLVASPAAGAVQRVSAAITAMPISTLIVAMSRSAFHQASDAKELVELAQGRDIAALIADDVALAKTLRADGIHLTWSDDVVARYDEARRMLGAKMIIGADAGPSRHAAMELGEANADYVGFGMQRLSSDPATHEASQLQRLDLVGWWSDIFEPPVVAFDVDTPEAAADLAAAGADFIALDLPAAIPVSDVAAWAATYEAAVAIVRAPA